MSDKLSEWLKAFAETNVHPDDKEEFLEQTSRKNLIDHQFGACTQFRFTRLTSGQYREAEFIVIPGANYSDDDPYCFLFVKDILE